MTEQHAAAQGEARTTVAPIVVGVTPRDESQRALEWAIRRAAALGAELRVVAVAGGAAGTVGEGAPADSAEAAAAALAERAAERARAAGVSATVVVADGNPVQVLVTESQQASVVVIGGRADERGPHEGRIASKAECTVVVVPDAEPGEDAVGVVVGVDASESSNAAVEFAAAEAERLGEKLVLVSAWLPVILPGDLITYPAPLPMDVTEPPLSAAETVAKALRTAHPALEVETRLVEGDPASVVAEAGETATLLVVGTHDRGPIARFLLGSVSDDVLSELPTVTAVAR